MAINGNAYASACIAILLPFLLIIWNRQRASKLNLPWAGSGFRTPWFMLPIASLFWGRDLIEDIYNKVRLPLRVMVHAIPPTSLSKKMPMSLNLMSFPVY
jgi:hypothetical protein